MTAPISVISSTIPSLSGNVYVSQLDVAGINITPAFNAAVTDIQNIVAPFPPTSTTSQPLTTADQTDLENNINILRNMMRNGYTPPGGGPTEYVTTEMSQRLDFLFQSLKTVGVDPNAATISFGSLATAQKWQDLVATSLILSGLFNFVSQRQNQSLQTLIELNYVATGNDLLATQMNSLQSALSTTQQALANLSTMQNLHNQITISAQPNFTALFNMSGKSATGYLTVSAFQAAYVQAASSYFGTPIKPTTSLFPTNPLIKYNTSAGIPANVTGLTGDINALQGLFANLPSLENPGQSFFVQQLGSGGYQKVNALGSPPDPSFGLIPYDPTTANPPLPSQFTYSTVPFNTFLTGFYAPVPTTIKSIIDGSTQTIYVSAGTRLNNDARFAPVMNNLLPLATNAPVDTSFHGNTLFWGVQNNTDIGTFNSALANFSSFVTAVPLPSYAVNQPTWIGYNTATKTYVFDTRNVSAFFNAKNNLVRLRSAVISEISALGPITPLLNGATDPNSLLAKLQQVLSDIKSVFVTPGGADVTSATGYLSSISGLTKWLLDNYQSVGSLSAGQFQTNITFAITAAQSLNDSQNESVRRFLFIFEEYYKSASAILQQITQILERVAQNIAGH